MTDRQACEVCGRRRSPDGELFPYLGICSQECFYFNFWAEKVLWRMRGDRRVWTPARSRAPDTEVVRVATPYVVRIGNRHYLVENRILRAPPSSLGMGGVVVSALVTDGPNKGVLIHSNNWWCQGVIPEAWRQLLPDNAVFLDKEEYERAVAIHEATQTDPKASIAELRAK